MTAAWLAGRLAGTPPSLRARIEEAVTAHAGDLRKAAEHLLDESKDGAATRDAAMTLLAADALVTLACQWAAEHDPDTLAGL
jgi:hypothetical protein